MSRILVVGPSWVGDMVMAQSLFIMLKQTTPDCTIDVLAPTWSLPILQRMPEVNQAIAQPVGHGKFNLLSRFKQGRKLRTNHYDQAIVIPRSFKSALIPYFANIPKRTGYRGEMRFALINDMRPLNKQKLTQTVQRYVALGVPKDSSLPPQTPFPKLQHELDQSAQLLERHQLSLDKSVVAMMPGAEYGESKRWPVEYYAQTAKALVEENYHVWVLGSEKDKPVADQIAQMSGVMNLCGKTQLQDVVDLLAVSSVAISNDSGLMHVAAAVDTPLVALYGSSTPDYTPPLTDAAKIMYLNLNCSPCFKRECPLSQGSQNSRCMRDITVQSVLSAVEQALEMGE